MHGFMVVRVAGREREWRPKDKLVQTSTFDLQALAREFPSTADTMLLDMRLTDEPSASTRLFRIYRPVPAHFHETCDEYLQVISGRGKFIVDGGEPVELAAGALLFFRRNVVHSIPQIVEAPLVVFSVDTPRRIPADVHFVNPAEGTVETFIRTISY
jgi:mannose-6-phosphate isomerase-like protein (cupin superfamily)